MADAKQTTTMASGTANTTPAQLHAAVLAYLQQLHAAATAGGAGADARAALGVRDAEPLEVAIGCLQEALQAGGQADAPVTDAGLPELFARGVQSVRDVEAAPKYGAFLAQLRERSDFFTGVPAGSLAYAQRLAAARAKFASKYAGAGAAAGGDAPAASAGAAAAASSSAAGGREVSAADKAAAELLKNEGNALLGAGDHKGAIAKYSAAIERNPRHAVYYANRAASHIHLRDYASALIDCQESIAIDPSYAKSHYRLGQSLAATAQYSEALSSFERALSLSARDEGMAVTIREQIKQAKAKMAAATTAQTGGGAMDPMGGLGGLGGMGGLGGLGGMDFSSLLSNPALGGLMNSPEMAQMMQSPEMANMMKNFNFGDLLKGVDLPQGGLDEAARSAAPAIELDTAYTPPAANALFDDEPAAAPGGARPAAAAPAAAAPKPASASASGKSGGGGGGALPPQLQAFLNTPAGREAANDPDLKPVLADIQTGGVGAAMKYMGNPTVMAKIQKIMGPLMGGMGGGGMGGGGGAGRR